MYELDDYGAMIADRVRTNAYAEAVARAVKPGDVVLEIGCGPGLFSLLACRAGAKRVYAMESNASVAFARELVVANGCAERIEILHGSSRQLSLPDRANVILSDIRGVLPLLTDGITSLEDARQRFLAPGGVMIPGVDRLFAALASVPEYYEQIISPWQDSFDGVRLSPMLKRALNSTCSVSFDETKLISAPLEWGSLDYRRGVQGRVGAELRFRALRDDLVHGVCLWFETTLFEEFGYSTGHGHPNNVYGQLFLPWLEPVSLKAGEEVLVELHADPVGGNYIWRWGARFSGKNQEAGQTFSQSMLDGARFSPDVLRRRSTEFVPKTSPLGQAESWVLQAMDGTKSLQAIADATVAKFPGCFRNSQEALELVSALSDKFAL
jgi:type I protein arginine methyltransferase